MMQDHTTHVDGLAGPVDRFVGAEVGEVAVGAAERNGIGDFQVGLVGIVLLIRDFSWLVLAMVILLLFLATLGNGVIRGSLACKYCKQREIGCPAEQLFAKG